MISRGTVRLLARASALNGWRPVCSRRRGKPLVLCLLLGTALFSLVPLIKSLAYDNDNGTRTMQGGPHRAINALALKKFLTSSEAPPVFARYEWKNLPLLRGEGVTAPGWVHFDGSYKAGKRDGSFIWWVTEGGYTADEPELYASFRHFYDPKAIGGQTYLTDHLDVLDEYYQLLSTKLSKRALGKTFSPQVDAREWAVYGPAKEGFGDNMYCWERGVEAMRQGFQETDPVLKEELFAKAWRSLGEVMHLLSDMASPAHVRNDSHPGLALGMGGFGETNPNVGMLRADPYESYCTENLVVRSAGHPVTPKLKEQIQAAYNVMALFDVLAGFTQDNFFSPDTLSGLDRLGRPVSNANGQKAYPSPRLDPSDFNMKTGCYEQQINQRPIRLAHESWLLATGWGSPMHAARMTYPCVQDQASILVPAAIEGCMKLADLYIPKVEVRLDSYDPETGVLKGSVVHLQSRSAYPSQLQYSSDERQRFSLYIDGGLQNSEKISLKVTSGEMTVDLSKLTVPEKAKLVLLLEVAGMRVRSEELALGEESMLAFLKKTRSVDVRLKGPFRSVNRPGMEQRDEPYSFQQGSAEIQQWGWSGSTLSIVWKKTYTNHGPTWDGATRTARLSLTLSGDGKTLSSGTLDVDTAFKDGPRKLSASISSIDGKFFMPNPELAYSVFNARFTRSGADVVRCSIRTQTGSYLLVQELASDIADRTPVVEIEFQGGR